jgi:hypothetical protein
VISAIKQYNAACFYLWGADASTWDKLRAFILGFERIVECSSTKPNRTSSMSSDKASWPRYRSRRERTSRADHQLIGGARPHRQASLRAGGGLIPAASANTRRRPAAYQRGNGSPRTATRSDSRAPESPSCPSSQAPVRYRCRLCVKTALRRCGGRAQYQRPVTEGVSHTRGYCIPSGK